MQSLRQVKLMVRVGVTMTFFFFCVNSFASDLVIRELSEIQPDDIGDFTDFGYSVDISGSKMVVGAPTDSDGGFESGSAYVYSYDGSSWQQEAKLLPSDDSGYMLFGWSVDISGDRVVVGAPGGGDIVDDVDYKEGAAYIFEFDGGFWGQTRKFVSSEIGDAGGDTEFGYAVSLGNNRVIVGDPAPNYASFHVFDFDGQAWVQSALVRDNNNSWGWSSRFGESLALDGGNLIVGAKYASHPVSGDTTGAAYVFEEQQSGWFLVSQLLPSQYADGDEFGTSVDIQASRALVAKPFGAEERIYLYEYDGSNWLELDQILAPESRSVGQDVVLSGNLGIVGAPEAYIYYSGELGYRTGGAAFFDVTADPAELKAQVSPDRADTMRAGWSVAADSGLFALGAPYRGDRKGAVFTYRENRPPAAEDDVFNVLEGGGLIGDVFEDNGNGGDSDPDGDALSVSQINGSMSDVGSQVTLASGAIVTLNANGSISYDPNGQFDFLSSGATAGDSFTYTVSDGAATDNATVSVTITGVNDDPVAANDLTATDEANTVVASPPGVLSNDSDVDSDDILTVSSISGSSDNLGVAISGDNGGLFKVGADGGYSFDPNSEFEGLGSGDSTETKISYSVADGNGGLDTAFLMVTVNGVNDAPLAANDFGTTDEDSVLSASAPGVLSNDDDVDVGDLLIVDGVSGAGANVGVAVPGSDGGLFTINADGGYDFEPNGEFDDLAVGESATTFVEYRVSDGHGGTDTTTLSVTVTGVNDAPEADPQSLTTAEDNSASIALAGTDPEGQALAFDLASAPANGSLSGAAPDLNYTPDLNFNGSDSFSFEVCDPEPLCDTATVSIDVSAVNDAPSASDDLDTTDEDSVLSVSAPGVLSNDEDVDAGDTLIVDQVDGDIGNVGAYIPGNNGGQFAVNSDGSYSFDPNGEFESLGRGDNVNTSVGYRANDGNGGMDAATLSVTVSGINDVQTANPQSVQTPENTSVSIVLTASDPEGDSLHFRVTSGPAHGTLSGTAPNLAYDPDTNFNGADSFEFEAWDPKHAVSDTATVTINVVDENDRPNAEAEVVSTPEDTSVSITLTASDPDGDSLNFTVVDGPSNGSLSGAAPNLTYGPDQDFNGSDSFDFKVCDPEPLCDTATVDISVTPVNDAPTAELQTVSTPEDTSVDITLTGSDAESDSLTFSVTAGPSNGTLFGTAPNLTYLPDTSFSGSDSFEFEVCDSQALCDTAIVSITVHLGLIFEDDFEG